VLLLFDSLSRIAHYFYQKYYMLTLTVINITASLIALDYFFQVTELILPPSWVKNVGKGVGGVAFALAAAAASYYGLRDYYAIARKLKIKLPAWWDENILFVVNLLRMAHPFVGTVGIAVALLHGYLLWQIWATGRLLLAVESGVLAMCMLVLVAISGLFIRWLPKIHKLRHVHRVVGILFFMSFIVHKIFE